MSGCQHKRSSQKAQNTIVCGKISNFQEVAEHDVIQIMYHDLFYESNMMVESIDSQGLFRFDFTHEIPCEIVLRYGSHLSFYTFPGDSLYIEIDGACRLKKPRNRRDAYCYYKVGGSAEELNRDMVDYSVFYDDSLKPLSSDLYNRIKTCSPGEFKAYLDSIEEEVEKRLDVFFKSNGTCKEIRTWARKDLEYEKWWHLLRYPWMHPGRNNMDLKSFISNLPEDYFDFIDWGDGNYRDNLSSKYYIGVLKEFYIVNDLIETSKMSLEGDPLEGSLLVDTLSKVFSKRKDHFERNILLTKLYSQFLSNMNYLVIKDVFMDISVWFVPALSA
jgi:hypothetical protein